MPPKTRTKKAASAASASASGAAAAAAPSGEGGGSSRGGTGPGGKGGRRPTRRTNAGKAKANAGAAAAAAASSAPSRSSPSSLATLLRSLQAVAETKARCTAALQAIIDGDCPSPSSTAGNIQAAAAAASAAASAASAAASAASSSKPFAKKGRTGGRSSSVAAAAAAASDNDNDKDNDNDTDPADDASRNASLIPLTTHVLQRLLTLLRTEDSTTTTTTATTSADKKLSIAVVAVALSHTLAEILLTDRPRMEKCAHAASSSGDGRDDGGDPRSVVGRAVVTSSLATLAGLEVVVAMGPGERNDGGSKADEEEDAISPLLLRSSAWSALRTLERLAHLNINHPSVIAPSGSGVQHSQVGYASPSVHYHATSASGETVRAWKNVLRTLCEGTELRMEKEEEELEGREGAIGTDSVAATDVASLVAEACGVASIAASDRFPGEMDLLQAALSHSSTSTEPDVKASSASGSTGASKRPTRKAGKKRGSSSSANDGAASLAAKSLLSALPHSNSVPFDGRISVRRWASMSLVWFGVGQKTLLELATQMLRTDSPELADGAAGDSGTKKEVEKQQRYWSSTLAPPHSRVLDDEEQVMSSIDSSATTKKRKRASKALDNDEDNDDGDGPPTKIAKSAGGKKKRPTRSTKKSKSGGVGGSSKGAKETSRTDSGKSATDGADAMKSSIPGNVALVAFAARLVDLANEVGTSCGVKAPGGGMESYARAVLVGASDANGKARKDSSRTTSKKKKKGGRKQSSSIPVEPTSRLPGGGPSPDLGWVRPDIRHEASELVWRLMAVHSRCLSENFSANGALAAIGNENGTDKDFVGLLVNDDKPSGPQRTNDAALCHPFIPRTMDTLARCAASTISTSGQLPSSRSSSPARSSSGCSSSSFRPDNVTACIGKIMTLASALAVAGGAIVLADKADANDDESEATEKPGPIVADARLASMAVCTLSDCVKRISAVRSTSADATGGGSGSASDESVPTDLVERYRLDTPLIPSGDDKAEARVDGFCSYGGTLVAPPDNEETNASAGDHRSSLSAEGEDGLGALLGIVPSRSGSSSGSGGQRSGGSLEDGDVLAFFLRAMLSPSTLSTATSSLSEEQEIAAGNCTSRLLTQLLGLVGCCYSRCPGHASKESDDVQWVAKMTFAKSALAADSLDALRRALLVPTILGDHNELQQSKVRLRCCLRTCGLLTEHTCRLVELGYRLEDILVRSRLRASLAESKESQKTEGNNTSTTSGRTSYEYLPSEKRLWDSHIKCCLTVGRGRPGDVTSNTASRSHAVLGDSKRRLAMHQAVADASSHLESGQKLSWPLPLPAVQHALVTSNLSCEPSPKTSKEAAPEKFICDSFVAAISEAMQDLGMLADLTWGINVPLSLRDARLFVLALLRMPKKEQTKVLSKLVETLHASIGTGSSLYQSVQSSEETSASSEFLARVVTVIVTAVDGVRAGRHLVDTLCMQTAPDHYLLPSLQYVSFNDEDDWYKREKSFMGLFSDWESPGVPVPNVMDGTEPLTKAASSKLIGCFLTLFDAAFRSAKDDRCHLLFTTWNALADSSVWDPKALTAGPSSETEEGDTTAKYARQIIEIREDMCAIHRRIVGSSDSAPDTMLFRGLTKKGDTSRFRNMGVSDILKTSMNSAVEIVDKIVASLSKLESLASSSSSAAIAVYEAVAIYISFLISLYTKSEKDVTSYLGDDKSGRSGRRKESGMSDSIEEGGVSSDESDYDEDDEDDARMAALSRLHDACDAIGAAPIHPDWLDTSIRIRIGISPSMAADAARTALNALTRLANAVRHNYDISLQQLLQLGSDGEATNEASTNSALALRIYNSVQPSHSEDPSETASKVAAVATTLGVNKTLLSLIGEMECKNKDAAREAWCPNSAQRIRGAMQECGPAMEGWEASNGEQRAAGEWELLLSDALLGACTDVDVDDDSSKDKDTMDLQQRDPGAVKEALIKAERWRRVLHGCADALVPCTALLRLGLNCGRGRQPHPMSKKDSTRVTSTDEELECPSSPLPDSNIVSFVSVPRGDIKAALASTVALLGELASQSRPGERKTCRAAMCHLLGESSQISDVEDLVTIRTALSGLFALDQVVSMSNAGKMSKPDEVIIKIIEVLESHAGLVVDDEEKNKDSPPSPNTCKASSLLASLGLTFTMKVDTLTERRLDATDLLLEAQKQVSDSISVESDQSLLEWKWGGQQEKPLRILMHMLFEKKELSLADATRASIARLLSAIVTAETNHFLNNPAVMGQSPVVLPVISKVWNYLDSDTVKTIIREDVCLIRDSIDDASVDMSKDICSILMHLACSNTALINDDAYLPAARAIVGSIKQWAFAHDPAKGEALEYQMNLLCTLATRFNLLKEAGSELLRLASGKKTLKSGTSDKGEANHRYLWAVERFFHFAHELHKRINEKDADPPTEVSDGGAQELKCEASRSRSEERINDDKSEYYTTNSGARVRRTCTFVDTGGDFKEQHWYNCYTCGLLWDKGCCTLCALTCHCDHDVGYSRKSSFFCDCGAEVASAGEQNRVACRCLSPLSSKELATIYDQDPSDDSTKNDEKDASAEKHQPSQRAVDKAADAGSLASLTDTIDMVMRCSPSKAEESLGVLVGEVASSWGNVLVELFDNYFEAWSKKGEEPKALTPAAPSEMICDEEGSVKESGTTAGPPGIAARSGKILSLVKIQGENMVPVRAAKASALNVKLSADNSTDRIKKALLSKNGIKRNAIVSDSRGRIVVAEPNSLFFCSALPLANVRFPTGASTSSASLDRSQLCCLGSHKVNFCIVGMQFCPDNDRHLVIWGTSEAAILLLSKKCDKVEKKIDLMVELEPHECETEYLLKCEWLPFSETLVSAICGTFVKVFDARRSTTSTASVAAECEGECEGNGKSYSCASSTCYTLAYEDALIRSAALIPLERDPSKEVGSEGGTLNQDACAKLALLFDSGRMHFIDITYDSNGDMEDQAEIYIETIEGIAFPTAGVRRYSGATPGAPGASSSTFGEGSSLAYLEQSGVLLYKCISSCVVALIIDRQTGDITGSFEFLPQVLTSSMIGSGMDGYSISAPYVHWTELGVVEKDGVMYYRVACTGKSTRTNQPKVLLIEFNVNSIRVKELSWNPGSTVGLGLSLNTSFEGFAAFSTPVLEDKCLDTDQGDLGKARSFNERAFLACLTSNGSMLVFGEELAKNTSSLVRVGGYASYRAGVPTSHTGLVIAGIGGDASQPKFPLTIFETLLNVSDSDDLILGGDGVGKDPESVKRKLSIHNGEFFLAPSREGCTITLSLRQSKSSSQSITSSIQQSKGYDHKKKKKKKRKSSMSGDDEVVRSGQSLVIVAVRLLLGSTTTDYLPRQVSLMGRVIKFSQGVKRWYDLPLTDEEIMLGIRSGFVTLNISSSFDASNNPLVDSMEVYALPMEDLSFDMPLSASFPSSREAPLKPPAVRTTEETDEGNRKPSAKLLLEDEEGSKEKLDLSLLSTIHAAQIAKGTTGSAFMDRKSTLRSIEVTALERQGERSLRQQVMNLLRETESDADERQQVVDEGTLSGVSKAMLNLQVYVDRLLSGKENGDDMEVDDEVSQNALAYLPGIFSTLNECLVVALEVARERPANYTKAHIHEEEGQKPSIALMGKNVVTKSMALAGASASGGCYKPSAAHVVELGIREIGMEWSESIEHAKFVLVLNFLRSPDLDVVETITDRIVSVCLSSIQNSKSTDDADISQSDSDKPPIAYQCDSCETFPIQKCRYTLEGGHDIDLCQSCYDLGRDYARSSSSNASALINSKTFVLSTGEDMTCRDLLSMKRVSITEKILEEVRKAEQASENDEEAALQLALKMSLEESSQNANGTEKHDDADTITRAIDPESIISPVFNGVLELATRSLLDSAKTEAEAAEHAEPLLNCLLRLVSNSESEEMQIQRGKRMAENVCQSVGPMIEASIKENEIESAETEDSQAQSSLNVVLCTLSSLINGRSTVVTSWDLSTSSTDHDDNERDKSQSAPGHKDKTDPRFVCDVHGVPAVRRRCSKGVHKDRRFYVCGMERKLRCKYFKWADEAAGEDSERTRPLLGGGEVEPKEEPSFALKTIQDHVWLLLTATSGTSGASTDPSTSLYFRLCTLISNSFKRLQPGSGSQASDTSLNNTSTSDDASTFCLHSLTDEKTLQEDWCDGTFRSKAKLRRAEAAGVSDDAGVKDGPERISSKLTQDASIVHACLHLLGSVASTMKVSDVSKGKAGDWYPLLCEIISTSQHSGFRTQAKRLLKRLCGSKSNYHRVRDHYIFGFQFQSLLRHCVEPMQAALIARERARQCGPNWRGERLNWKNLTAGALLGTCDLVSEDALPIKTTQKIDKVLNDLIELTKNRGNNWRHFCALATLPQNGIQIDDSIAVLSQTSPIVTLFWIVCSLPSCNVKALRLIEVALTSRSASDATAAAVDTTHADEIGGIMSTDAGTDTNELSPGGSDLDTPEKALFSGQPGLKADDVYAFVMQFVLRGNSVNLRSVARGIGHTMCHMLSSSELEAMFATFITVPLREVQAFGQCSVEYLELLQALASDQRNEESSSNVIDIAQIAASCFTRQLSTTIQVLQSDDSSVEVELESGSGQYMKKSFDLCSCAYCHRENVALLRAKSMVALSGDGSEPSSGTAAATEAATLGRSASARRGGSNEDSSSTRRSDAQRTLSKTPWLDDQVRPYTKSRLELSTEAQISAEFTSYVKLKCRMAVSDVHLSVSDPRGRLVKTIAVYFTPRHVSDVNELKKDEYLPTWQHCGNLSLSRGATRASFKMSTPIIAANMKFEYAEFYEKANSGRSADANGGLILHCPRCTRVVNNAHGVCGHCGEVAFQCRKCRHINYDKLDAFLCVECGYCASGGFSYDLTAGMASNAVAITNEEDYERGVRLLRAAAKRQTDLRDHKLRKKLLVAAPSRKKRAREADFDDLGWLSSYSPQMKRAMLGELPRSTARSGSGGDGGHGTDSSGRRKSLGRKDGGDRVTAASKARSLLSLARHLRNDTSSGEGVDGERLSRGDMLVRQALLNPGASGGGAGSFEMVDDHDADMLGLIGGSSDEGAFGFDMPDPLSRLVADIQARVRGSGSGAGDENTGGPQGGSGGRRRGGVDCNGSGDGDGDGGGGGNGGNGAGSGPKDAKSPREKMEELDTLHQQMRDAERECFELRTRLNAWTRLNCDRLADTGTKPSGGEVIFTPTTCRKCSGKVTLSMLLLVVSILQNAEGAITRDFVRNLFEEPYGLDHDLVRYKRLAIVKIALLSDRGADMVLNELKLRLKASQDVGCAEILGSILGKSQDVKGLERFVQLAEVILTGNND